MEVLNRLPGVPRRVGKTYPLDMVLHGVTGSFP